MAKQKHNVRTAGPSGVKRLRVGELARAVGKTVRAVHLYEELGLLTPAERTEGGFRMYDPEAIARIGWIVKLQAIGFTLSQIQGFVAEFESASSGRVAATHVRDVFRQKLEEVRSQITQFRVIENDLGEALEYLDACQECSTTLTPVACTTCDENGHERGSVPPLFAGVSRSNFEDVPRQSFDVSVGRLSEGSPNKGSN